MYIRIRPWLTLDQEGTALMFHSWFECSANGPVFIYRNRKRNTDDDDDDDDVKERESRRLYQDVKYRGALELNQLNPKAPPLLKFGNAT